MTFHFDDYELYIRVTGPWIAFVSLTTIRVSVTSVGRLYRFGVCSACRNNGRFCQYKSFNPGSSGVTNVGVNETMPFSAGTIVGLDSHNHPNKKS